MFIKQADLFSGVHMLFIQRVMDISHQETHPAGVVLFQSGDPAENVFILIQGQVSLTQSQEQREVHVSVKRGESFAWAGLIDRPAYTSTATCTGETRVLKINVARLKALLEQDPENGMLFFRNLACALGNRLIQCYQRVMKPSDAKTAEH